MERVTVETDYGSVSGSREDDLVVFRGMPYARPPVGPLRFRPPAPPERWSKVRDATGCGPLSIQPPPNVVNAIPGDPLEQSEDCLHLNLWTPGCDEGRRPVMVWFHGGGFTSGSASSALYAGHHLARNGVVLVSAGYRLGALGWLAHPCLGDPERPEEGFGNWGLRDQVAALEWVQAHAARFGGDPANVTVFGESAGGMSVAALLGTTAPRRGLFHKAVVQSGAAIALGSGSATLVAEELAAELGLESLSREVLEAVPPEEILAAQIRLGPKYEVLGLPFQPVIDGGLLPDHPAALIEAGSAAGVSVVIGTNRDEWRFWTVSNAELANVSDERLTELVARTIHHAGLDASLDAAETLGIYREARLGRGEPASPPELHTALSSDWVFRVPSMRLAGSKGAGFERVFAYLFDWESPFAGGILGSCHALELPFVFGSLENPSIAAFAGRGEEADRLSQTMRSAWTAFAAAGDPSSPASGPWPEYETMSRSTKRFGRVVDVVQAPMETERAWLDEAWGAYGDHERAVAAIVHAPGGEHLPREGSAGVPVETPPD
jgi:para-nitrobenzyl esterase